MAIEQRRNLEGERAAGGTEERSTICPKIRVLVLRFRKKNKETYLRKGCR